MADNTQHHLSSCLPEGLTFVRTLGTSPLSEVLLVRNQEGLLFALKVMRASVAEDERIVERWNREAQTLIELQHSHLVRCYGACTVGERPALILEYISGGTLREELENGPISWEKACRYGVQISRALECLHRHGAIHRDVKPHNVLLHPEHGAVLADLGLVLREEDPTLTSHGAALGSPAYMSPEQSRNPSDVYAQTDIYSLGATLYHAIAGRPPFVGKGVGEVLHRLLHEEPRPLGNDVPSSLQKVISVAMSKDEEQRYDRARSMGSDLGRVLLGDKPRLRTLHHGQRLRKRWFATSGIVAAAILIYSLAPMMKSVADSKVDTTDSNTVGRDTRDADAASQEKTYSGKADPATSSPGVVFAEWIYKDASLFYWYVQNRKLHAAERLLIDIESRTCKNSAADFDDNRKKWITEAKVQIRAAAEGLAAVAFNLLEHASSDAQRAASNRVYDAVAFNDLVNKLWRAANVDINQLSLAAGHPDVKERLAIVKDRLEQLRQQSCEDLRDKIIADTRSLLLAGNFADANLQFESLPEDFVANDLLAGRYVEQARVLKNMYDRFNTYFHEKIGQEVRLAANYGSDLVGAITVDENDNYQIHYRGQANVYLQLLDLDAAKVLKRLGSYSNFELAQLLYFQGRLEQALEKMKFFTADQPEKAQWWVEKWLLPGK
ncbi:MAG: serine/threonine-protein kinase [Planctomycetota bacterium]|nr:serine/threonine-protein kinase [Planctomycetota bacterium]